MNELKWMNYWADVWVIKWMKDINGQYRDSRTLIEWTINCRKQSCWSYNWYFKVIKQLYDKYEGDQLI